MLEEYNQRYKSGQKKLLEDVEKKIEGFFADQYFFLIVVGAKVVSF